MMEFLPNDQRATLQHIMKQAGITSKASSVFDSLAGVDMSALKLDTTGGELSIGGNYIAVCLTIHVFRLMWGNPAS